MPSVNLRQLRDTRQLKRWLEAGETVELRERDRVIGEIKPRIAATRPEESPDFAARLKADFGNRMVPIVDMLVQDRENSRF